jgi:hypothetical protein
MDVARDVRRPSCLIRLCLETIIWRLPITKQILRVANRTDSRENLYGNCIILPVFIDWTRFVLTRSCQIGISPP